MSGEEAGLDDLRGLPFMEAARIARSRGVLLIQAFADNDGVDPASEGEA